MTAKELIELLKLLPPETRIFTEGYEGGLKDADMGCVKDVALDWHTSPYFGPHNVIESYLMEDAKDRGLTIVRGVCL